MRSRMTPRTAMLLLLATAGALVGAPAAAPAAEDCPEAECVVPKCLHDEIWGRRGLERRHRIVCLRTDRVTLAEAPGHGEVTRLGEPAYDLYFSYRPDDDAPATDRFVLELEGRGGTRRHPIDVTVTPDDVNTPPQCDPVEIAKRTTGLARERLSFNVMCRDREHDDFVIEGGGPGDHSRPHHKLSEGPGYSSTGWSYTPLTKNGAETTTYWATDSQGARSAEAAISTRVGLGVDRLPTCQSAHPGIREGAAARRFMIICEDADGDPYVPAVATPPNFGIFAMVPGSVEERWNGALETWMDATYAPLPGGARDDRFTVAAAGALGTGPPAEIVMRVVPDGVDYGAGCGYSGVATTQGVPARLWANCSDSEGDPISAEIVDGPDHGTAAPPVATPALYGRTEFTIGYVPDPAFTGIDCVVLEVTDGHGNPMRLEIDIFVNPAPVVGPIEPPIEVPPVDPPDDAPIDPPVEEPPPLDAPIDPPVEEPPPLDAAGPSGAAPAAPAPPQRATPRPREDAPAPERERPPAAPPVATRAPATSGQPAALTPVQQARLALGTRRVRLVRRLGHARVYAPRGGRRGVVAVSCAVPCVVRAGRRITVMPGTARVLSVPPRGLRLVIGARRASIRR
jgi:hypothetical protein